MSVEVKVSRRVDVWKGGSYHSVLMGIEDQVLLFVWFLVLVCDSRMHG